MSQQIIVPVLIAFVITAVLGPVIIPVLRKLKVGQTEREELKSHLKKEGTPTMGGLMILAGIIATSVLYMKDYPKIMPILFVTVGFGIIGFLDDYLKVVLRLYQNRAPPFRGADAGTENAGTDSGYWSIYFLYESIYGYLF